MSFNFQDEKAWETGTESLLPRGNHLCTIAEAEPGWTKDHSKPELDLRVENDQGSMRDWIQITPNTVGKVVQVFDACGAQRPGEGDFNPNTGELTEACVARLRGRKIGVVIRGEADNRPGATPGAERDRIKGYVTPDRVTGGDSDAPIDSAGLGQDFAGVGSSQKESEPDIPF